MLSKFFALIFLLQLSFIYCAMSRDWYNSFDEQDDKLMEKMKQKFQDKDYESGAETRWDYYTRKYESENRESCTPIHPRGYDCQYLYREKEKCCNGKCCSKFDVCWSPEQGKKETCWNPRERELYRKGKSEWKGYLMMKVASDQYEDPRIKDEFPQNLYEWATDIWWFEYGTCHMDDIRVSGRCTGRWDFLPGNGTCSKDDIYGVCRYKNRPSHMCCNGYCCQRRDHCLTIEGIKGCWSPELLEKYNDLSHVKELARKRQKDADWWNAHEKERQEADQRLQDGYRRSVMKGDNIIEMQRGN